MFRIFTHPQFKHSPFAAFDFVKEGGVGGASVIYHLHPHNFLFFVLHSHYEASRMADARLQASRPPRQPPPPGVEAPPEEDAEGTASHSSSNGGPLALTAPPASTATTGQYQQQQYMPPPPVPAGHYPPGLPPPPPPPPAWGAAGGAAMMAAPPGYPPGYSASAGGTGVFTIPPQSAAAAPSHTAAHWGAAGWTDPASMSHGGAGMLYGGQCVLCVCARVCMYVAMPVNLHPSVSLRKHPFQFV